MIGFMLCSGLFIMEDADNLSMVERARGDFAALAWLLQPISIKEFFENYYERAPLYVARNRAGYYDGTFSLEELDRILYGNEVGASSVILYQNGLPTRRESFVRKNKKSGEASRDVIDADRVSALFSNGCSIVFDTVQDHSDSMGRLLRGLETALKHRVGSNVYMTPPHSQGFTAHYDTHDTAIMQIAGSKRWRIYGSPTELPLESQSHDKKRDVAGDPVMEIELQSGDLLYLPRGVMHEARAGESFSLHVTLGFYPNLWVDVVREALEVAATSEALLRKVASSCASGAPSAEDLRDVLNGVIAAEALEAARARLEHAYVVERRNPLDGQLGQIATLGRLSPASSVSIRPQMLYEIEETPDETRLLFSNKTLLLPAAAAAIVRALESRESLSVGALLQRDSRALEIVRKLIQEGFLYVSRPPRTSAKLAAG